MALRVPTYDNHKNWKFVKCPLQHRAHQMIPYILNNLSVIYFPHIDIQLDRLE